MTTQEKTEELRGLLRSIEATAAGTLESQTGDERADLSTISKGLRAIGDKFVAACALGVFDLPPASTPPRADEHPREEVKERPRAGLEEIKTRRDAVWQLLDMMRHGARGASDVAALDLAIRNIIRRDRQQSANRIRRAARVAPLSPEAELAATVARQKEVEA